MAKEEIKRFNEDVLKYQKLVSDVKNAGSNVDEIVAIANNYGFNFTVEDVNELKVKSKETGSSQPNGTAWVLTDVIVFNAVIVI